MSRLTFWSVWVIGVVSLVLSVQFPILLALSYALLVGDVLLWVNQGETR